MKTTEIDFYIDTLLVESFFHDDNITKKADSGFVNSLILKVKEYFESKIDPNDKIGSLLNMIAPGTISIAFSALGLGKLGTLIGLAMSVFHIDVKSILSSIYDKIKAMIITGSQTTSEAVHNAVMSSVQEHMKPATEEEANEFFKKSSFVQRSRDIEMLKISLLEYETFVKTGKSGFFDIFSSKKNKTASILGNILSWIFRIALASAGLLVAGDAVNKLLNRPNSFDGTIQKGKPIENKQLTMESPTNKLKLKSSYVDKTLNDSNMNWIENVGNNAASIESMLLQFANDVYEGLEGKENIIKFSPYFQSIVDKIEWYNNSSKGSPVVFIPKNFTSKKSLVDSFITNLVDKLS